MTLKEAFPSKQGQKNVFFVQHLPVFCLNVYLSIYICAHALVAKRKWDLANIRLCVVPLV